MGGYWVLHILIHFLGKIKARMCDLVNVDLQKLISQYTLFLDQCPLKIDPRMV